MKFDINVILTALAAPLAVLAVKTLLDFSLSHYLVKWLSFIPVRTIFRDNPSKLSGEWEQVWEAAGSPNFLERSDRQDDVTIRQFGKYCYAEFTAKDREYRLFGKIHNNYLLGEWYDANDRLGYFGVFELRIVSSRALDGMYLGHSSRDSKVGHDTWVWIKREVKGKN